MTYISIPGWRKFQHDSRRRGMPWIKDYVDQEDRDEYRDLTFAQRGLLQSIRHCYARSQGKLRGEPAALSRRIGQRVRYDQLVALEQAGFIEFVASAALADGYHDARLDVDVEKDREEDPPPTPSQRKRPKTSTPAKPKPAPPAKRDELWDTFDSELGPVATKAERGRRNRALKDLREIGCTPLDLKTAIHAYRRRWSDIDVTETAIAANWSTLLRPSPNGRKLGPAELMALANQEPLQ